MTQTGYLWELQRSPRYDAYLLLTLRRRLLIFVFRHNVCNSVKLIHSVQAFYCSVMRKRKRLSQQRSGDVNVKKPKARALIGKPSQSNVSIKGLYGQA